MLGEKGNTKMLWVIAAIIGLVVGYGISYAMGTGQANSQVTGLQKQITDLEAAKSTANEAAAMSKLETDTKAANLRVLLNALEREHVALASAATRNGFDGNPGFDASAAALLKNSDEIAAAVGSVYGADAQKKFLEIWNSHITFFVDYTVAAKKGDKAGMDAAVNKLNGYVNAISDFFSGANPNLPRQAVHDLVSEHVTLLKGAVDAWAAKDYAGSFTKQHEAGNQIGTIADALSGAIVKQNPGLFK